MDFNQGVEEPFGDFDTNLQFLPDAQLAAAPEWTYLPAAIVPDYISSDAHVPAFKFPDGIADGGKFCEFDSSKAIYAKTVAETTFYTYPAIFGSNVNSVVPEWDSAGSTSFVGFRQGQQWPKVFLMNEEVVTPPLMEGFGGVECRPVTSDFDGDQMTDRAVLCLYCTKLALIFKTNDVARSACVVKRN